MAVPDLTVALFIFSTTYGFLLLVLYVCILIVMHRNRKNFDSSFFKLFMYEGYLNIFLYIVNYFTMRIPMLASPEKALGLFYGGLKVTVLLNVGLWIRFHMSYVQYSLTSLVTLNRGTVLYNYNYFEPWWKKYCTLIVLLIVLIPLIQTHKVFYYTAYFKLLDDNTYSLQSDFPGMEIYAVLVPYVCFNSLLSLLANSSIFFSLRKKTNSKQKQVNFNFICIMSITSIIQGIGSAMTASLVYFSGNPTLYSVCKACLPYVSELLTLVAPVLLVKFSQATRESLLSFFGVPPKKVTTVVKSQSLTR